MNKKIVLIAAVLLGLGLVGGFFFSSMKTERSTQQTDSEIIAYECNGDGKICPDGSVVGRTGESCEFMACPAENATSTIIRTTLGQPMTGLNVTLTPKEIISDSRCPQDVQCIWAGTVEVKVVMATQVGHGEHVVSLNEPKLFGDFLVTLTEVTPAPKAGESIPGSSYRFVFEVTKR